VLEAHRAIDAALSLRLLHQKLRDRAGPERWERWQSHMLSDDLAYARAEAATRALASYPEEGGPEAARKWLASKSGPLAQASSLARRFEASRVSSLSLGALAVRALVTAVGAVGETPEPGTARPAPKPEL
jgi:NAD-specific glutamate dehydrogenase